MSGSKHFVTPFILPVAAFIGAILTGGIVLSMDFCASGEAVPFVDALFTATSAVCVTGLATVDVFSTYNRSGQSIVLFLIQLGGIGIITYTTLIFYMIGKRISLRDRLAVTQGLLYSPDFHIGKFIQRMVATIFLLEAVGAFLLWCYEPERIGLFNAVFIAVSAFCNAGFAPWADNLIQWDSHWGVNLTVVSLIVAGGLGFFVFNDLMRVLAAKIKNWQRSRTASPFIPPGTEGGMPRLTYFSRIVISTTLFLLVVGTAAIFFVELGNKAWAGRPMGERFLIALFQSATSRTAGFATADMALFSDITLLITMMLMFIGGSPGSCAGGIKTTAFRILCARLVSHLRGNPQVVVAGRAMDKATLNKAMLLLSYSLLTIITASFALTLTENGLLQHRLAPLSFMDIFFEVVSAFATVGLSVNLTPSLSSAGKLILCLVMFIGKLGPVWLVTTIQQFQPEQAFRHAEDSLPIG